MGHRTTTTVPHPQLFVLPSHQVKYLSTFIWNKRVSAKIHLHFEVYEMSKNEQFKDNAIQFATLNIAHEMIHMLTGKIYGETPSNNYKMSPDKPKFKVKVP